MPIKEIIKDTENKMKKTIESAKREFSEVRTGRAHPGLIEGLHADYFGAPTMIKQLASISIPDPRTVFIQPWDPNAIQPIEKAISSSNLGIMPSNDGKIIRLNIPSLSEERRKELIKVVKDMAERSRVSLRTVRRDSNDQVKKMLHDKAVPEDEGYKAQENIQKLTDKYMKEIDHLFEEKSKVLTEMN
ncbi:MAG: ribosome recycling factor [Candidatus Omnitrophica bacterium]|nr:ribosome recycling factor [Candidatus Omnitrophota bacterium]